MTMKGVILDTRTALTLADAKKAISIASLKEPSDAFDFAASYYIRKYPRCKNDPWIWFAAAVYELSVLRLQEGEVTFQQLADELRKVTRKIRGRKKPS